MNAKTTKKTTQPSFAPQMEDFYANPYQLDPALRAELEAAELEVRFINADQYRANGFHKSYWKPYKRTSKGPQDQLFGTDPEGFTRRKNDILAVRPKSIGEQHRAHMKSKRDLLNNYNRNQAKSLRQQFREQGLSAQVLEGDESEE